MAPLSGLISLGLACSLASRAIARRVRNREQETAVASDWNASEALGGAGMTESCADEVDGKYSFMRQVGQQDYTVFYIYGKALAKSTHRQFLAFSSEPDSGKFGVKDGKKERHLNYYFVKGEKCLAPTSSDCEADLELFPGQQAGKGSNNPSSVGRSQVIGMKSPWASMQDTYDASNFGMGILKFSLEGDKMVATTTKGCKVDRVNVCKIEGLAPKIVDIYSAEGLCDTIIK